MKIIDGVRTSRPSYRMITSCYVVQKRVESFWAEQCGESLIEIPPGHLLIFRENMIHKVYKNPPVAKPLLRMHTSFLLSESDIALHDRPLIDKHRRDSLAQYFDEQRLPTVRSGQDTQVYSSFHLFPKVSSGFYDF